MLGRNVPFPPMEAELVKELPTGDGWQYEPKWDGKPLHKQPLEERRAELERIANGFRLSPTTGDPGRAEAWLDSFEAAGLDGVIAKRLGLPYLPGSREGVLKVKPYKTADCVIVGLRWKEKPTRIATLLPGLYNAEGTMEYVGSAA